MKKLDAIKYIYDSGVGSQDPRGIAWEIIIAESWILISNSGTLSVGEVVNEYDVVRDFSPHEKLNRASCKIIPACILRLVYLVS